MKIIGVSGSARSGKSTVAMHLVDQYSFGDYAFAEPIKKGLREMFGLTDEQLYEAEKDAVVSWLGVSPRELFQTLGTEWGRGLVAADVWVRCAERWLSAVPRYWPGVVFSDVRFEEEATFIRRHGGLMVHVWRDDVSPVREHPSERGVAVQDGDVVLPNNNSLDELYARVSDIVGVAGLRNG